MGYLAYTYELSCIYLTHYNDTGGQWTAVATGNGIKTFDPTLYKEVIGVWMNGNNDVMGSTWIMLNWFPGSEPLIRVYAGTTSCPLFRFNFNNKTVNLDMNGQNGRLDLWAR